MNGELRALGMAQGMLLGLLLASPMIAPALFSAGVGALFVMGGFQLRLADRRWERRDGVGDWVSHIRMAPQRLLPWGATATVALIAGRPTEALAILMAVLACEMLLYPLLAPAMGRLTRGGIMLLLLLMLPLWGADVAALRYASAYLVGVGGCVFWLRGPDGDGRALGWAIAGSCAAAMIAVFAPDVRALMLAGGTLCATLALAHLSVLRRRPVPWHSGGDTSFRRLRWPLRSRPS